MSRFNASGMRPTAVETQSNYTIALDYDISNNLIYIGKSEMGASKASAVWKITKLTYDASNNLTDMTFAGGDGAYTYIWNNRTTLTYS